jgi:Na+-translocating ferredoxin:NAD+ oxidoreductase subunit G
MTDKPTRQAVGFWRQSWLVLVLAGVYGAALAGVQTTLAPRIAENKQQETLRVIPLLIPGADVDQTVAVTVRSTEGRERRVYQTFGDDGKHNGWVLPASGQGFVDTIELLIGLDVGLSTITGLYVLDHKETPGLGDRIQRQQFADSFRGRPLASSLRVVKAEPSTSREIQAVSGATVSSWAVCEIVNAAIDQLREPLARQMSSR